MVQDIQLLARSVFSSAHRGPCDHGLQCVAVQLQALLQVGNVFDTLYDVAVIALKTTQDTFTDMSPSNAKCIVLGVPSLKELFAERHYGDLEGGILENFGRLLSADMVRVHNTCTT